MLITLPDHPAVFADALLIDRSGLLLFLSLWARDTQALELIARIQLAEGTHAPGSDPGVLHLRTPDGSVRTARIADPRRLLRHQGRMPAGCVFGTALTHTWIYDRALCRPHRSQGRVLMLTLPDEPAASRDDRLWATLCASADVPLLPGWKTPVLTALRAAGLIDTVAGIGIDAISLDLDGPADVVGDLVRGGQLAAEHHSAG